VVGGIILLKMRTVKDVIPLCERIFSTAKDKGVQQKELAGYLGVSPSVLSDWKIGRIKPSVEMIDRVSDFLNVSIDYLLGKTDIPSPLVIPEILKGVPVAFHRGEFEDLTQEEVDSLARIAVELKSLRKE